MVKGRVTEASFNSGIRRMPQERVPQAQAEQKRGTLVGSRKSCARMVLGALLVGFLPCGGDCGEDFSEKIILGAYSLYKYHTPGKWILMLIMIIIGF